MTQIQVMFPTLQSIQTSAVKFPFVTAREALTRFLEKKSFGTSESHKRQFVTGAIQTFIVPVDLSLRLYEIARAEGRDAACRRFIVESILEERKCQPTPG